MRADVRAETWPIAGGFRIARGAKTHAEVLVVELDDDGAVGRGECVPYNRYGESKMSVKAELESALGRWVAMPKRSAVQDSMPPGAARNAIDCALWDLEAKRSGKSPSELLGTSPIAEGW